MSTIVPLKCTFQCYPIELEKVKGYHPNHPVPFPHHHQFTPTGIWETKLRDSMQFNMLQHQVQFHIDLKITFCESLLTIFLVFGSFWAFFSALKIINGLKPQPGR